MVTARIGAQETATREVEFMVDTGAFYTILPPELFDELDIESGTESESLPPRIEC